MTLQQTNVQVTCTYEKTICMVALVGTNVETELLSM